MRPEDINILIGCEESATVRDAFLKLGFNAWSCDILPTRGDKNNHFECDILRLLNSDVMKWHLIILHYDCTKTAVSGNRWYGKGTAGHQKRLEDIEFAKALWGLTKKKAIIGCAYENPVSVIWKEIGRPQYIQPHDFGHGETKKTGILLHNLPLLKKTNEVSGREQKVWKMPPGKNRKRDRSKTYQGIAYAMAEQWGDYLLATLPTDKPEGEKRNDKNS